MQYWRRIVLILTLGLFVLWLGLRFREMTGSGTRIVHFFTGALFVLLIMLRRHHGARVWIRTSRRIVVLGAMGTLVYIIGLVIPIHQFQWIGLLLVVYASLTWALPAGDNPYLVRALFLAYWVHPLPSRIFNSLQFVMQKLSVLGSEWVTHALNMRVWADGMILRTGFRDFEIPAACSGMQTATTVMLCALGAGFYYHWRPLYILVLLVFGLAQALLLNIARISTMVGMAMRKSADWSSTFLHDTTGTFLLMAILLLHLEVVLFNWWRLHRNQLRASLDQAANAAQMRQMMYGGQQRIPWKALVPVVAILLLVGMAGVVYKRRPSHRAAMIAGTVEQLVKRDLAAAERAARRAVQLDPGQVSHQILCARTLLGRGKHEAGLELLDEVAHEFRDLEYTAMQAWGLFALGRADDSQAILDALPAGQKQHPGIAMTAAALAARRDDPDAVEEHLRNAAAAAQLVDRVRSYYGYLANHRRWRTIAKIDARKAFNDPDTLRIALTAHMLVNDTPRAEATMRANEELWQNDPGFIKHLQALALRRPHEQWARIYCRSLLEWLDDLSLDEILDTFDPVFELHRPNVGWVLYDRMVELSPDHPAVHLVPAQHAHQWFTFYKSAIDIRSAVRDEKIDLRAEAETLGSYYAINPLPDPVPFAAELATGDVETFASARMSEAFVAFERWYDRESASYRLDMLYGDALIMIGDHEQAHRILDRIDEQHPDHRIDVLIRRARLYDLEQDWERTYGSIKAFYDFSRLPVASLNVVLINALLQLDLGMYAMEVARESVLSFPDSAQVKLALATVWEAFGFDEDALFVTRKHGLDAPSRDMVQLLEKAGRFAQAAEMRNMLELDSSSAVIPDQIQLPPAERAVTWAAMRAPTPGQTARIIEQLRENARTDGNVHLRNLYQLGLAWHLADGKGVSADPATWSAIGTDPFEKASALHNLSMLHARAGDLELAQTALEHALDFAPSSPILWRMRIAMSAGDPDLIQLARQRCPDDPEIFLAHLVMVIRGESNEGDLSVETGRALKERAYSPGTFVRAADLFFRHGFSRLALETIEGVIRDDEYFLPAYSLGIRAALALAEPKVAYRLAIVGADLSPNPWPLRKVVVRLKMSDDAFDLDLAQRLRELVKVFPGEAEWSERLGQVLFRQAALDDAWRVYTAHLARHRQPLKAGSYARAAETARLTGRSRNALEILRVGQAHYPNDIHIANNMLYTMAQARLDLGDAERQIERLLALGESPAVYDTIAVVYHVTGNRTEAERYLVKALEDVDNDGGEWEEIVMNGAEMYFEWGDLARSRELAGILEKRSVRYRKNQERLRRLIARIQTSDRTETSPDK